MSDHTVELFVLKCAVIEAGLRTTLAEYDTGQQTGLSHADNEQLEPFIKQFDLANRKNAAHMSRYYEIFYLLETTSAASSLKPWKPRTVRNGGILAFRPVCLKRYGSREREAQAAVSVRSEDDIDYTTFGQLGDIIRANWSDFAGMLSNQSAVSRVMAALNMLRGTIAHCGVLAEDEVDRLKLAIRDWFRVLEGPKS